jgi:hypothetical protein
VPELSRAATEAEASFSQLQTAAVAPSRGCLGGRGSARNEVPRNRRTRDHSEDGKGDVRPELPVESGAVRGVADDDLGDQDSDQEPDDSASQPTENHHRQDRGYVQRRPHGNATREVHGHPVQLNSLG